MIVFASRTVPSTGIGPVRIDSLDVGDVFKYGDQNYLVVGPKLDDKVPCFNLGRKVLAELNEAGNAFPLASVLHLEDTPLGVPLK